MSDDTDLPPELRELGDKVARLPRPVVPAGLAARTMARLAPELGEAARVPHAERRHPAWRFWINPITHPAARLAAAAFLLAITASLGNVNTAERVGRFFEGLMGTRATERVEVWVDRMLLSLGPDFGGSPKHELVQSPAPLRPMPRRQQPQGALPAAKSIA